jgi:hypothetical protein
VKQLRRSILQRNPPRREPQVALRRVAGVPAHARQSIESMHEGFKDSGKEALELPARRRVRGFTAAQTFLTVGLTNYNLRKIASFLHDEILRALEDHAGAPVTEQIVRRRDRVWYNPYTKTTPRESVLELAKAGLLSSPLRT